MSTTLKLAAIGLATMLLGSGVAKVVSGHDAGFLLGIELYYAVAALEIALAVVLATRFAPIALLGALVLAGGGLILQIFAGDRQCGCFGSLQLTSHEHVMVASAMGALAGTCLWLSGCRSRVAV